MTHVPFVDLRMQSQEVRAALVQAFERVLDSGSFVLGREVADFERSVAVRIGTRHAVGVSSGTDALLCALRALDIGPSDEVITTPLSFIATAESILRTGASVRFADVDRATLNIDPVRVEEALTPRTRAIVAVHLYGRPAALDRLSEIALRRGIALIEDAAQAFGSALRGRAVGTWGRVGCFSFFPTKLLGAMGDAGLVATDDDALAAKIRQLRQHGGDGEGRYLELGGNFRIDALQAALLSVKIPHIESRISRRREHARAYDDAFGHLPGVELFHERPESSWNGMIYTLRAPADSRDALRRTLADRGVETRVYYDPPLHLLPVLKSPGGAAGLPESERAAREVVSLPLYPELAPSQRDRVIDTVRAFFASSSGR